MTDKQIIKEKGNIKCIFYNDDICRKGDKTRDCLNCARVEYHSLYKLNWENQERLESQLKRKKQECKRWKEERDTWHFQWKKRYEICECLSDDIDKLCEQRDQLKAENEELKKEINNKYSVSNFNVIFMREHIHNLKQTLTEIKEIAEKEVNNRMLFADKESFCDFNKILQKISECEVEDEHR